MSMSKKDFIALADELRKWDVSAASHPTVIAALVEFMHRQNPQFMEGRWREYLAGKCGPNGGAIGEKPK